MRRCSPWSGQDPQSWWPICSGKFCDCLNDGLGRKTAETNANGQVFLYTYNGAGDLTSVTDPKSNVIHWDYDDMGRRSIDYDVTAHRYFYNADSRVTNLWTSGKGAADNPRIRAPRCRWLATEESKLAVVPVLSGFSRLKSGIRFHEPEDP